MLSFVGKRLHTDVLRYVVDAVAEFDQRVALSNRGIHSVVDSIDY